MKLVQIAMFLALVSPLLVLADPAGGSSGSKTPDLTPDQKKTNDKSDDKANKRPKSPGKPEDKKPDDHDDKRLKPDSKGKNPQKPDDKNRNDENRDPNKTKAVKELEYDCEATPNACKNMCWGRFCRKGKIGHADEPIHFGGNDVGKHHRGASKNGYKPPTKGNPCTEGKKDGGFSEKPTQWTSMDEWPMASFRYDLVKDEEHSVGYRCLDPSENKSAGAKMTGPMKIDELYKVKFKNAGKDKIGVDWCMPTRTCHNDGYQFSFNAGKKSYTLDPDVTTGQYNKESRDLSKPAHPRDFMPELLDTVEQQ
ncbi:MAG: hypothetical protein M1835_000693 [Candelina submexicana]|nr:MAG: hypothetical protein M1835_000693 [Candelina submexicana]